MKYLLALLMVVVPATQAQAFNRGKDCRYASLQGNSSMNIKEVKLTIACAVRHMPVSGGVAKALYIANRESGFYTHAYNTSGASGVYQIVRGTWHSWTQQFANWRNQEHINTDVFSGRSNVLVAIRAAHMWGWRSWGG